MLLHGFTGSPASWERVALHLGTAANVTVLAPALPGHHSAAPVITGWDANIDELAGRIRRFAQANSHLVPVHMCGYSLGARTALGLAVRHPGLIARLTLIGVHPGLEERERTARQASDQKWIELLRRRGTAAFTTAWEKHPIFASQAGLDPEIQLAQKLVRLGHDPNFLADSLQHMGLGEMPDYREQVQQLAMPVTLATGERDGKFSALADGMADGEGADISRISIVGSGHNAVLEQPRAVAELLARLNESPQPKKLS